MSSPGFLMHEGWRARRRSGHAGSLALFSLAVLSAFIMVLWGLRQSAELMRDRLLGGFEIEAFLKPGRERELAAFGQRMAARPGVAGVELVTREEAARKFAELHGEDLMSLLAENPLPASVILHYDPGAVTVDRLAHEADEIAADADIEDVSFEGDLLARFERVSGQISIVLAAAGGVMMLISLLLTTQAVRVAAKTGESWARAVYLIGGTRFQVRGPLAAGGMLTGLFGGLTGVVIVGIAQEWLSASPWIARPDIRIMLATTGISLLLGWLGAATASRRKV